MEEFFYQNKKKAKFFFLWLLLSTCISSKGEIINTVRDCNFSAASVGDYVWLDRDGDGNQDSGETGFGGVSVVLSGPNGIAIATTITDINGYYLFTGIDAGISGKSYQVLFKLPAGYRFSPSTGFIGDTGNSDADQSTGKSSLFTLLPGESNTNIDAGLLSPANNTLPLHHLDLTVALRASSVTLRWLAENEMNTTRFIIQRSIDGLVYSDIDTAAVTGQINTRTNYSLITDIQALLSYSVIYYRIKAEDNSHLFAYSNVAPLKLNKITGIRVWPNPSVNDIRISYNCSASTVLNVLLTDNTGRIAWQRSFEVSRGVNQLSVTGMEQLTSGVYFVHVTDKSTRQVFVEKIVK
jgi:hypothetical protein